MTGMCCPNSSPGFAAAKFRREGDEGGTLASMRIAGVHAKGGRIYLAVLEIQSGETGWGKPVAGSVGRFEMNTNLGEAAQLSDLTDRVRQHLSGHKVERVALVETRSFANWKYADAYARVIVISAVMASCNALGLSFVTVKTNAIAKSVGVSADKLQTVPAKDFGYEKNPTYWTTGLADAFAVAKHDALSVKP